MTEFAKRMITAEPSIVRELYKVWALPGMHSLGAGSPSVATFPAKEIEEISAKIYAECYENGATMNDVYAYGVTEGVEVLRDVLRKRYLEHYRNGNPETDDLQAHSR